MHQIKLHYSRPVLRQAVLGFWWRVIGIKFLIAMACILAAFVMLVRAGDFSWRIGVLASVIALGVTFIVALYVVHYRNTFRKLKAMGASQATLEASESSLSLSSGAGTATLPWTSVIEVWRFKTCWLLLFSKAQFITLPLADLTPETEAWILDRVRASGGKID